MREREREASHLGGEVCFGKMCCYASTAIIIGFIQVPHRRRHHPYHRNGYRVELMIVGQIIQIFEKNI